MNTVPHRPRNYVSARVSQAHLTELSTPRPNTFSCASPQVPGTHTRPPTPRPRSPHIDPPPSAPCPLHRQTLTNPCRTCLPPSTPPLPTPRQSARRATSGHPIPAAQAHPLDPSLPAHHPPPTTTSILLPHHLLPLTTLPRHSPSNQHPLTPTLHA